VGVCACRKVDAMSRSDAPTGVSARIRAAAVILTLLTSAVLTGCAGDAWEQPAPAPSAVGALGAGFLPEVEPTPEATIEPTPGSWSDVHPSAGYRVVLLSAGDDEATRAARNAVGQWAAEEGADLRTVDADEDAVTGIVEAIDLRPDLIVSASADLVEALTLVTASHLDQQFLILGGEVPEPTENVTSVSWTGGAFRGEGLGASSPYDASTFTAERVVDAVRLGVAAILNGLTGYVYRLD